VSSKRCRTFNLDLFSKKMKIAVQSRESKLKDSQRSTGIHRRQRKKFIERVLARKTDFSATNEQLESSDIYETR
jgi:hypothetical protein